MPIPDSWDLCIGQGSGSHSCCVHVGPVKAGSEGPFVHVLLVKSLGTLIGVVVSVFLMAQQTWWTRSTRCR